MKDLLRIVATACIVALFGALVWHSVTRAGSDTSPESAAPDRYLASVASATTGPVYAMPPGGSTFRFITFLHLERQRSPAEYSPLEQHEYGLKLAVKAEDGSTLHEKTIWFVTRKSKAQSTSLGWELESAYYPIGVDGEPCDPRMIDVDLEAWAGQGRELEVRAVSTIDRAAQVNLLAFTSFTRPETRIDWLLRTMEPTTVSAADRPRIDAWDTLEPLEQRAMLRNGWRRQTTLRPATVRTLFSTDFRVEVDEIISQGEAFERRALAYNLRGPVRLSFAALSATAVDVAATVTTLRFDGTALTADEMTKTLTPHRSASAALDDAAASFHVDIPSQERATVWVRGDADDARLLAWVSRAEAAEGDHPLFQRPTGGFFVQPDYIRFHLWEVRHDPLEYLVGAEELRAGDAVIVAARRPADSAPPALWYAFDEGPRHPLKNDAETSRFETIFDPTSERPEPIAVTEPVHNRIWVPRGAQKLRIFSDEQAPQWISVAVISVGRDLRRVLQEPYEDAPPGARWRYARHARHPWHTIGPDEDARHRREGRRWDFQAQARWTPDFGSPLTEAYVANLRTTDALDVPQVPATETADVIRPNTRQSWVVLEPLADGYDPPWTPTHLLRLTHPGSAQRCRSPGSTRFLVHGPLNAVYEVSWDGQTRRRRRLRTRTDGFSITLPRSIGALRLAAGGDEAMELWAGCQPVASDDDVWRSRRSYRVDANGSLRIPVVADDETWNVNVVVYGERAGRIRAVIDDGEPARRGGAVDQLTFAEREFGWSDATMGTRLLDDPSVRLALPLRFVVPIGSDLEPGPHELRLDWAGARSSSAYVRLFRVR